MAKLSSLIKEVLYEEKEKNLKLYYTTDIFIQEFPEEEEPEEEPEQQAPVAPEPQQAAPTAPTAPEVAGGEQAPPAEATEEKEKPLNEEIFKSKTQGELTIPNEEAKSILTLNDLLEHVGDKKDADENQILNDLVVEVVKSLSGQETDKAVQDVLNKGDKCNIIMDYGFDKEDSIGLQVSKNPGVNLATMIMRKDGNPMTGDFNLQVFNQTITSVFLKELQ